MNITALPIRKPEFMGNTRIEEKRPKYKIISDLPWSEKYIKQRIKEYETIAAKVTSMSQKVAPDKQFVWFQLIEFPVRAAHEMNKKKASLRTAGTPRISRLATERYGIQQHGLLNGDITPLITANGKKMMSYPQSLPVFKKVPHTRSTTPYRKMIILFTYSMEKIIPNLTEKAPVTHGLGYQRGAISLSKGSDVIYNFKKLMILIQSLIEVALTLTIRLKVNKSDMLFLSVTNRNKLSTFTPKDEVKNGN